MKFTKRKKILLTIALFLFIGISVLCYFFNPYYWFLENHYGKIYDQKTKQLPVNSKEQIDALLESLPKVPYSELPSNYLQYTQSNVSKFQALLKSRYYYKVEGEDIFKFLVGNFRIKDFMAKDSFYYANLNKLHAPTTNYFLIDKNLLYALLELQETLEEKNYNKNGFTINFAHRHPSLNKEVGGAGVSYHIRGQAIDLVILDIDNNGIPEKKDKAIVLELLETKIIKDKGGIGKYPWSPVVHFDVRGYKARWDKQ